ncbi:MAG TPA: response regulator [Candidatus Tectomicrobia bacterium]
MASILLVDDTPLNLEVLRLLCHHAGYTTRQAISVEPALVLARAQRPDLIISDIHMAPLDGYDLLRIVKADPQLAPIPVMLMSMSGGHGIDRGKAMELGAVKFIAAPVEAQVILAEIQACLGTPEASHGPGHA